MHPYLTGGVNGERGGSGGGEVIPGPAKAYLESYRNTHPYLSGGVEAGGRRGSGGGGETTSAGLVTAYLESY